MSEGRKTYHQQLDDIRDDIVTLAASVIEGIPRVTAVLLDGDLEGANYVVAGDAELDHRSVAVEERCYQLMALQQPMAGDLRLLIAVVRIVGEIERSADLVVNIAKAARRIYGAHGQAYQFDPKMRGIVTRMGEQAQQLFRFAIDAFVERDAPLAGALDDMDDVLDRLHSDFIQGIFEAHAQGRMDIQIAVQTAVIARFYERIGDHAVNIGERVLYMVTGQMPTPKPGHDGELDHLSQPFEGS